MSSKHLLIASLLLATLQLNAQQTASLTIDTSKITAPASPMLYGLMTEEINFSYDGGLYAELVSNRTFQNNRGPNTEHWTILQTGTASAVTALDKTSGPSAALPHSLKLTVKAADAQNLAGIANEGFWGYPLHPNSTYSGSFYARADSASLGPITVRLIDNNTGAIVASTTVRTITSDWQRYPFTLKTATLTPSSTNHLDISVQHPGTAWFTLISLFPPTYKDRTNGFRTDIMEKLAAMN